MDTHDAGGGDPGPKAAGGSRSARSQSGRFALVVVVVLLGSSLFFRTSTVIEPRILVGAMAGFGAVIAGLVLYRTVTATASESDSATTETADGDQSAFSEDGERTTSSENGDSSVWNAIPSWQYGGRHVESGGLARGEQEQALREIQEQAEELSDDPAQNEP